jgi:hypothetical protein
MIDKPFRDIFAFSFPHNCLRDLPLTTGNSNSNRRIWLDKLNTTQAVVKFLLEKENILSLPLPNVRKLPLIE